MTRSAVFMIFLLLAPSSAVSHRDSVVKGVTKQLRTDGRDATDKMNHFAAATFTGVETLDLAATDTAQAESDAVKRLGFENCSPFSHWLGINRDTYVAADFDGDGDLDLISTTDYSVTNLNYFGPAYYENTGHSGDPRWELVGTDCTSTNTQEYQPRVDPEGCSAVASGNPLYGKFNNGMMDVHAACEDFDGDGDIDCAFGDYGAQMLYLKNSGTASAPSFEHVIGGNDPANPFYSVQTEVQGHLGGCWTPVCHDWDGDGDVDCFIWSCHRGQTVYLKNEGNATNPSYQIDYTSGLTSPSDWDYSRLYGGVTKGDIDGDGDVDILMAYNLNRNENNQALAFIENTGSATAPAWAAPRLSTMTSSWSTAETTESSHPFHGITSTWYQYERPGRDWPTPTLMDWDNDGDLDLLMGTGKGNAYMYKNVGTPTSPSWQQVALILRDGRDTSGSPACNVSSLLPPPTSTSAGPGGGAYAVGDPHLQNVHGERFDLMKEGKHVLMSIPRGKDAQHALLRVQADARRLGDNCAEMYFKEVNVTGAWAEAKNAGGYHYSVSQNDVEAPEWVAFGKVELKVVHGRTDGGLPYLNVYMKHLRSAGVAVGGLLGEDDHEDVITPPEACTRKMALAKGQKSGQVRSPAASVAMATFEQ